MTMYNFLDPKLMPKVTCSAASTDNYEATNLISESEVIRARGYLAYTVIKPPVDLEFELLCPVDISYIILQTSVGRQKCTGIEIFARSDTSSYISIGRAVYDQPGLTFCNSRKYSKTNPPDLHDSTKDLFFFKRDTIRIFSAAKFLKVLIFRTDRSVPCLASVKVVGAPARSCSGITVDTINKIMGKTPQQISVQSDTRSTDLNTKSADFKIPEDYLDDLTCEVMAVPMTLPSGKTVDRDTLEKHIENEKSFGRKPGDPFTGLKFTETRKPVMNVALKSRLDMFLMQNSNNPITYGLKRTIGSDRTNTKRLKLTDDNAKVSCCVCEKDKDLYVIPCQHCYCRSCLLTVTVWKCGTCKREFSKSDATKYHH